MDIKIKPEPEKVEITTPPEPPEKTTETTTETTETVKEPADAPEDE